MKEKNSGRRKRKRILSVHDSIVARLKGTRPSLRFKAKNVEEWREWRQEFEKIIRQELGPMPEKVPLNPEIRVKTWENISGRKWSLTPNLLCPFRRGC